MRQSYITKKPSRYLPQSNINTEQNYKPTHINHIDRQNIVEDYHGLRQRHQQWLSKINLSDQDKRDLFGLSQSYYCTNKATNTKIVCVNDFFRGKLIMKQKDWLQLQQKRSEKHQENQKSNNQNQFAKLDISIDKSVKPPNRHHLQADKSKKKSVINQKNLTEDNFFDDKNLDAILDKVNKYDGLCEIDEKFETNENLEEWSSIERKGSVDGGQQMDSKNNLVAKYQK